MVCLGVEPGAAEWKARTNPLSYGVTRNMFLPICLQKCYLIIISQTGGQSYIQCDQKKIAKCP